MYYLNGAPWTDGCPDSSDCAGTPIDNRYDCYAVWRTSAPWASGQLKADFLRVIPAHAKAADGLPRFGWRYVAKYPTTDGLYWVMGRDRSAAVGTGNWVFVPYACI